MAQDSRNTSLFTYVDNDGNTWNARGEKQTAVNAIDGSTTLTAGAPVWINSKKRRTRKVIFEDPATFRTKVVVVFTAAAFTAITGSTTLAVPVPGSATAVTYSLSQKIDEKQPIAKASRNLAD